MSSQNLGPILGLFTVSILSMYFVAQPRSFAYCHKNFLIFGGPQVEEKDLLYTFTSFIAEFGGALDLFLEVSFMTIWQKIWVVWKMINSLH